MTAAKLPWYMQPSTLASLWFWGPLIVFLTLAAVSCLIPNMPLPTAAGMIGTWLLGAVHVTVVEVVFLWRKK